MKIGVLGSGIVGQTLGRGLAALGHEVKLGTREPDGEKLQAWVKATPGTVSAGTFAEAAAFAELAVLATLWEGTENALRLADPENLAGKLVIDVTNPLEFPAGAAPRLALGHSDSGGERVQRWLPDARVVKAFNTVGNAHMVRPEFPGGPPDMFICGNDEQAKRQAAALCDALGWPVVDMGGIEAARLLEPLAMVWIMHGIRSRTWNHAFKLLKRD